MVRIPHIKIPSVRVGGIDPTSDIGTAIGGVHPTPIIYLTQWKIVGNSEVHTDEYLTQWKVEGNSVVSNPSANLPQGYKKCKYIESHGTEYIELPFGFDKTDEVYLKGAFTRIYSDKHMVAPKVWNDDTNGFGLGCISSNAEGVIKSYIGIAIGSKPSRLTPLVETTTNILEYEYKDYIGRVGNSIENYTEFEFGSTTQNLRLFYGYNSVTQCKIYEYRHKKDNTEYHLIPCLDNNDVPCLYDTVSNTAFYNDGTGTFGYEIEQPVILSCGDYSSVDNKYHVKISNGVTIYDIPLTEPLRKVGDVADNITFANGSAVVTRCLHSFKVGNQNWTRLATGTSGVYRMSTSDFISISKHAPTYNVLTNVIGAIYPSKAGSDLMGLKQGVTIGETGSIILYDSEYNTDAATFKAARAAVEIIFELATPTTETIQVSPFPISPTDTYTSANDTPYSAFEYKKNVEIWSCGEYSAVDGKYHILVQPEGGSIADIALDEPLRKVNNVADTIEFTNGVATLTRNIGMDDMGDLTYTPRPDQKDGFFIISLPNRKYYQASGVLCTIYTQVSSVGAIVSAVQNLHDKECCYFFFTNNYNYVDRLFAYDTDYIGAIEAQIKAGLSGQKIIYELATPTTEVIQAPQIQEAESYSMVISQGAKCVSWSSFTTESDSE